MELNIDQSRSCCPTAIPSCCGQDRECVPGQSAVGRKCVTANEPFFQDTSPL